MTITAWRGHTAHWQAVAIAGILMGRAYAGTLGPLAFAITIARGIAGSSGVEGTILAASAALVLFAIIGYLIGQTADYLVNDSVRSQFQAAMAAWDDKQQQQAKNQLKQ